MWPTFSLILLTLTWIFRPTLAEIKSEKNGYFDVTFTSGELKSCENYEISVQLNKEKIIGVSNLKFVYLLLLYKTGGSGECETSTADPQYLLRFNEGLVFSEINEIGYKKIKPGSIDHKLEGDKVKFTIYKFRPDGNRLNICLGIRVEPHLQNGDLHKYAVALPVNFQTGSVTCEPPEGKCQYKDEYKDEFTEVSPMTIWTCKCKNGEFKKKNCEKKPNPDWNPSQADNSEPDEESDNSDSIPGTTEAPKEGGMMMVYIVAGVIALAVIGGATYFLFFKKRPAQTTANEGANSGDELQGPNEQLSQKEQESVASKGGPVSQASGAEGKLVESQKSGSPKTSSGSAGTGSS